MSTIVKRPATLVVNDEEREISVAIENHTWLISSRDLESAIGWELREEGLCRGDVCVPVRDKNLLEVGNDIALDRVAETLRRPFATESDPPMAVIGNPDSGSRLGSESAPNFSLPDIDVNQVSLDDYAGRKRLLLAWSSW